MQITKDIQQVFGDEPVSFIQIGASDGLRSDPIYELIAYNEAWSGMFVEPVVKMINSLRSLHENHPRFIYEQCAVTDFDGVAPFYVVSDDIQRKNVPRPSWWYQVGSLNKSHLEDCWAGRFGDFIEMITVVAHRLDTLVAMHNLHEVDLIVIDTEGYDARIIQQIDFDRVDPAVIVYEHEHLTEQEHAILNTLFDDNDYLRRTHGTDTIAIKEDRCKSPQFQSRGQAITC